MTNPRSLQLTIAGTNHNHAPVDARERFWCRPDAKIASRLKKALRKLGDVPSERTILEPPTCRIVNKLLYEPTLCLKAHATNGNGETYETVIREVLNIGRQGEQ